MPRDTLFFAHANGFPTGTYNKLLERLGLDFNVDAIALLGHDPNLPPDDNWINLKTELRREIEARHDGPLIGVGHSLGGVLHLLVAADRPELYKQIVLVEAPIISRFSSRSLRMLKFAGLIDRFSPSQMTRYRRRIWRTRDEALKHFLSKSKFAAFDEDVLRDYVEHGTVETDRGVELLFRPHIEARIYRTIPHNLPSLRGRLRMPITYIGGTDSREGRLARLGFMKKHFGVEIRFVEGTHLLPMERPLLAAKEIKDSIFQKIDLLS